MEVEARIDVSNKWKNKVDEIMNRKHRATAASIAIVALALLAISALATPVAAQGTVSIDAPNEVQADGDFDFTVTMTDSGVGEVAV